MKKFLAIVALAAVSATPAFAAKSTAPDLETANTRAVTRFNADFKGATGIWNNEKGYSEVLFFWHNNLMDSFYDKDGDLIGTFHQVSTTDLPGRAADKIASWYKEYEVKSVTMMERDDQDPTYYVTIQSPSHLLILEVNNDGTVQEYKSVR